MYLKINLKNKCKSFFEKSKSYRKKKKLVLKNIKNYNKFLLAK